MNVELSPEHQQTVDLTVRRLAAIRAQREELEQTEKALKGFLRASLGTVSQYPAAGMRITIATRRIFDPEKAHKVLTPGQIEGISLTKFDPGLARLTLPSDVYEQCLTETEAQVRIS